MQKVTIAAGKSNVVLPDGNMYQAGDTAVLSEEQAAQLTDDVKTNYLASGPAPVTAGDVDSARDEDAIIGDTASQQESPGPITDTTYE
ncbi:MAG TPA: hypothetical protein VGL32_10830 [Acidimicrobiales bacterium]|jgi:hypothetical protein